MPKYIKETESDYLAPIVAHDDNLTDEEKAVMDQKINEYLNKHK